MYVCIYIYIYIYIHTYIHTYVFVLKIPGLDFERKNSKYCLRPQGTTY